MKHPITDAALDDRLAFVGTAGSGKTYNAGSAVERLLASRARVVIIDPLGVWFGLRLRTDGVTASAFNVPIFGGAHGDLPLTEHAGALVGETAAAMAESCIVDLSQLGTKAAERRFMLAFLTALYRKTSGEPVHLVVDEADMFAPQKLLDKEGEAAKLLGMMETIVRRGRVKGFIPWLITQRPAVLSKDVLSQADALIAFKLTSSQDRAAIGAWIEGQADQQEGKAILASLPGLQLGQGIVWHPRLGVLETAQFPEKVTFDSSRTPKRGEKKRTAELRPLDLGALKERLATVEADTKANDPKVLKAEIARLTKSLASNDAAKSDIADPAEIKAAEERGFAAGAGTYQNQIVPAFAALENAWRAYSGARITLEAAMQEFEIVASVVLEYRAPPTFPSGPPIAPRPSSPAASRGVTPDARRAVTPKRTSSPAASGDGTLNGSEQKIVDAIRWWNVLGISAPSHSQVGFIAGYSHKSGTWATYLSRLRSAGMIEGRGDLVLTEAGLNAANDPDVPPSGEHLRETVLTKVNGPLAKILTPILANYPDGLSHAQASDSAGYSAQSGTWATYLSRLRSLDLIEGRGELKAQDWLFP